MGFNSGFKGLNQKWDGAIKHGCELVGTKMCTYEMGKTRAQNHCDKIDGRKYYKYKYLHKKL